MPHSPNDGERDIAIVGRSCRLPGAPSVSRLWELLAAGGCSVSEIPPDRWPRRRFGHPRAREPGKSYTWAAGVLDDIWGFDPAVFRVSPREAEQMDPQQRLLLELVFEACEDAGFAPSRFAGSGAGVYVGASALDYSTIALHDPALADAYFATGNTLSIVSNRISYIFDLHGPSLTVDTACSSSLVALHEACQALRRGEIEMGVVGGVNVLAGPFGFISFSQAGMLSPTGLCHAFSADADGYVRSEGGVVLILKTLERALSDGDRIHAVIRGTGVNTDGRTSGISLPAEPGQTALLRAVYDRAGVAPDSVVYVEAHGTGTQAGDPVEAAALGAALGRRRTRALPIGSIKTNIGHLEPASGLAGLMKAMLALEHDAAPPSLHCDRLNPGIDFAGLGLEVVRETRPLPRTGERRHAGVSSFGFGGANAHVILSDPPPRRHDANARPRWLMLSAASEDALRALAHAYAERLEGEGEEEIRRVVAATGRRREVMSERLVLPADDAKGFTPSLSRFASENAHEPSATRGTKIEGDGSVVFVFSGNGSQWEGMGRAALAGSPDFRDALREVDSHFRPLAGWSLEERLRSPSLARDIERTSVAQPLIFAIQAAAVRALAKFGVRPGVTMGHSVGEVAAAEASGALTLNEAVEVIFQRSRHQEIAEGKGGMAAIIGPRDAALDIVQGFPELLVATRNSWRCIVAAGPFAALEALAQRARGARKLRVQRLDLNYPFHSALMDPARRPLIHSLAALAPSAGEVPFLSTIDDAVIPGASLDARYWWRNIREPVLFDSAVSRAIGLGKRVFLEIGPRPVLRGHIRDAVDQAEIPAVVECALDDRVGESGSDPFELVAMRLLAAGAEVDPACAFGPDPGAGVDLPPYPWRRNAYRFGVTPEASGAFTAAREHPLIGARANRDTLEWRADLDPELEPALADHRIQGQTLLPGAAFVEMALAVARDWQDNDAAELSDVEILRPLIFAPKASREILCRVSASTATFEILSRPRLSPTAFVMHARGRILARPRPIETAAMGAATSGGSDGDTIYAQARTSGLEFGPAYRKLARARLDGDAIVAALTPEDGDPRFGLDPARLDSCFHGLILLFGGLGGEATPYVPVRFDSVRYSGARARLTGAHIRVRRADARTIVADFDLVDPDGRVIATFTGARYQPARARARLSLADAGIARSWIPATADLVGASPILSAGKTHGPQPERELPQDAMLIEGWASAAALELARNLSRDGAVDLDELLLSGRLPGERRRWAAAAFDALCDSGFLTKQGSAYRLTGDDLPPGAAVLESLAAQYPERSAELLLAAHVGANLSAFGAGRASLAAPSRQACEAFALRSTGAARATNALCERLGAILPAEATGAALRILLVGAGAATARVVELATRRNARLTILAVDGRLLERARHRFAQSGETAFAATLDALPDNGFNIVASAGGLTELCSRPDALDRIAEKCAPGAVIAAVEPAPSRFSDFVFGLVGEVPGDEAPRRVTAPEWLTRLARAGLDPVEVVSGEQGADPTIEILARPAAARPAVQAPRFGQVVIAAEKGDAFGPALLNALARKGSSAALAIRGSPETLAARKLDILVWLPGLAGGNPVARVADECLVLRDALLAFDGREIQVIAALDGSDPPFASAISSFLRTFANETPSLDIRRVEIFARDREAARALAAIVLSGTDEADVALRSGGPETLRYAPARAAAPFDESGPMARRLMKPAEGGLDRLVWSAAPRRRPGPGEIEVEVAATGLNFRDVMWALSVLPEEMLEGGFAGPTLGLEFSGRVVEVGEGVGDIRPGDPVLGLSGGAFATHLTVAREHVALVPEGMAIEAAATVPVAFLTAWHGLVGCADLGEGEWTLIHGGAGGVGLAALQIARLRGARAIVTAGTPEKRALALVLGAEHAFDSRSGAFCDGVMRVTGGGGVSVVLNSLAGELMERSVGLLEPFGRFVELGKRDYLADTALGLRPFRRNLSYFGVDLDQMLRDRPKVSRHLLAEVLQGFARGDLAALPYTAFDGADAVEAMRLMQQSGHIGKILVRPPKPEAARNAPRRKAFEVDPGRAHLVTGGLGGFGIETARWLVARGARRLVLVGRSGAAREEARRAVTELAAQGAEIRVEALDIADPDAADGLFARLARDGWPIAGVIHAAMTLDDGIVANLDNARLRAVLGPKMAGAENLDRLTRDLALDYFVLFSSATTLVGNPGQGAYVAANGYIEGLARRRRSEGLPALAIAWGAISDAGVVARSSTTREQLQARAGVRGMEARPALDLMAEALAYDGGPAGDGVLAIADLNWSAARRNLKILEQPAYRRLFDGLESVEGEIAHGLDLHALVATLPPDEARRAIGDIVTEELARILRLPRDEVSRSKPLSDIGLDSLMAVELALALETRLGLPAPLGESAGAFTVMTLAQRILSTEAGPSSEGLVSETLAARHLDESERRGVVEMIERRGESPTPRRDDVPASDAAE